MSKESAPRLIGTWEVRGMVIDDNDRHELVFKVPLPPEVAGDLAVIVSSSDRALLAAMFVVDAVESQ